MILGIFGVVVDNDVYPQEFDTLASSRPTGWWFVSITAVNKIKLLVYDDFNWHFTKLKHTTNTIDRTHTTTTATTNGIR